MPQLSSSYALLPFPGGTLYQPVTMVTSQGQVLTQAIPQGTIQIQNAQVSAERQTAASLSIPYTVNFHKGGYTKLSSLQCLQFEGWRKESVTTLVRTDAIAKIRVFAQRYFLQGFSIGKYAFCPFFDYRLKHASRPFILCRKYNLYILAREPLGCESSSFVFTKAVRGHVCY